MKMSWDANRDYIRTFLKNVEVDAHVGLHAWEKHPERPTRLLVTIECFSYVERRWSVKAANQNLSQSGTPAHSSDSIVDYDLLRDHLKGWSTKPHTPLLETLAEELVDVAFRNSKVEACRVTIEKPDIFNECDSAGIEIFRTR